MTLIAEFDLSNPIVRETRQAVPDVEFVLEDERSSGTDGPTLIGWASGSTDDLEAFHRLLPDDSTLEDATLLADLGERRLYRATLTEEGTVGMTYPEAVELGITFLDVRASGEHVRYRAHVPTREALADYRRHCEERDLAFRLVGLYHGAPVDGGSYGLTDRQREVLRTAFDAGYFDVPRGTSLEELAADLDVSDQALSALLRRGLANVLRETLGSDVDR